ncbi:MAG: glycerophosphodiester phosphodiesterase [Spirochaetes bacterium]|nr:glycerophosphodiester phosphodiesterase [Spirochaetota bacterium]
MKRIALVPSLAYCPLITAHAGCMGTLPNSRESIVAAFSSEAQVIEVDIRVTKDGAVVLAHDDSLSLEYGGKAKLRSFLWEDIRRHAASSAGSALLDLEEFFNLAVELGVTLRPGCGTILNLDAKEDEVLAEAAALVRKHRMESSVVFTGLDRKGIETARRHLSGLRYFFNADELLPPSGASEEEITKVCSVASEFGCCGINLEWTRASRLFVEVARSRELPVMLWTVDREEDMRIVLMYEPDSVTTNRPDLLAASIDVNFADLSK